MYSQYINGNGKRPWNKTFTFLVYHKKGEKQNGKSNTQQR